MTRARCRLASIALAAAAGFLSAGTASAGVVISASGPSAGQYPVGQKIDERTPITLRAGDTLTVLGANGTRVLRGAGTHSLAQSAGASQRNTFAVLTARRSAQRVRTGAVRGDQPAGPAHASNLWYVDVDRPGKICLADADRVRLWRKASEGEVSFIVSGEGGGKTQTIKFADGEVLAPWNTRSLPVQPGAIYRLADNKGVVVSEISFVVLGAVAEEPEALALQLIENGCENQLALLATATMIEDG